jgi:dCTP deaminase
MILTGREIERCVRDGSIVIDPFDAHHCNPNSYNFHVGDKLLEYEQPTHSAEPCVACDWSLDTRKPNPTREITIPPEGFVLQPGVLYLGHTVERIGSTRFAPIMAARSSLGRLGLFIFLNSGLGDVGFVGQWTLEFMVVHPLRIYPGDRVGQMIFHALQGEVSQYAGKYQGAKGPQASLLHTDESSSSINKRTAALQAPAQPGRHSPRCERDAMHEVWDCAADCRKHEVVIGPASPVPTSGVLSIVPTNTQPPAFCIAQRARQARPVRLLLDAGGVLVTEGSVVEALLGQVASLAVEQSDRNGDMPILFEDQCRIVRAFWDSSIRVDLWSGRIGINDAVGRLRTQFSITSEIVWNPHELKPLPWAERALKLLPSRTAVLSNHRSEWLLPAFARFGWSVPAFVSDQLGFVKPDRGIYSHCLARWGVTNPSEVLFVDNKQANVDAAIELGMHGLLADPEGKWVDEAARLRAIVVPTKSINVFIEGPNGSGKSTLADYVKNLLRYDQANLAHRPSVDQYQRYLAEYGRVRTVFCRAHWSEAVYSELFGRSSPFTANEAECLQQAAQLRGVVVLCLPPDPSVLRMRYRQRVEAGLGSVMQEKLEQIDLEYDLWKRALVDSGVADIVYAGVDLADVQRTAVLIQELVRAREGSS